MLFAIHHGADNEMKTLSVPHRKAAALEKLWAVWLFQKPYLAKHTLEFKMYNK